MHYDGCKAETNFVVLFSRCHCKAALKHSLS